MRAPETTRIAEYFAEHGYDTIERAAKLPYSDGPVGMSGPSYAAHTQADASKLHPPSLKRMVINMGGMSSLGDRLRLWISIASSICAGSIIS